jgi:5-methylcytosine-specific restriction endonuclease McrA
MGKWIHRLENIDTIKHTADCANCGVVRIIDKPRNKGKRGWVCQKAKQQRNRKSAKTTGRNKPREKRKYRKYVQDKCSRCGFIPEDICQLDVDHIDGNHKNNSVENLQTLCSNCHRVKTKINKEGPYKNALPRKPGRASLIP